MIDAATDASAAQTINNFLVNSYGPGFDNPHAFTEPHTAPDGSVTVVTGAVLTSLSSPASTRIYLWDGTGLRPFRAPENSHGARVSPDGRAIAFLADREGNKGTQAAIAGADGSGQVMIEPGVPGSVDFVHWSPDGAHLLLGITGETADRSSGEGSGSGVASARTREAWYPLVEEDVPDSSWRGLWLHTVRTGLTRRLSPAGLNCWEASWCGPDAVIAIASDAPTEDAWYSASLVHIALDGSPWTELAVSQVQLGWPAGSSEGRYAAYVEALCSDRMLVAGDLKIVDVPARELFTVDTAGTDVTWLQWIDERRLGYAGQRGLDSVVGIVDCATFTATETLCTRASLGDRFYPRAAFDHSARAVFVRSSYASPPELVRADASSARVLATTANAGTDFIASVGGCATSYEWIASDGQGLEGIVCKPATLGPHPLVVDIHGGPVYAYRETWMMGRLPLVPLLVSQGYAVFCPNPRGSSGRGQLFAHQAVGDMGGADASDLLLGIDSLVQTGIADPSRIGVMGLSYGGFMTSWLITQDARFAAAVSISPVTDWYSQTFTSNIAGWGRTFLDADPEEMRSHAHSRSPVLQASKTRTPCLSIAGAKDRCTPPGQAREFHQALRAGGVPTALVIYPEEGHGVRGFPAAADFITRVSEWFNKHMGSVVEER